MTFSDGQGSASGEILNFQALPQSNLPRAGPRGKRPQRCHPGRDLQRLKPPSFTPESLYRPLNTIDSRSARPTGHDCSGGFLDLLERSSSTNTRVPLSRTNATTPTTATSNDLNDACMNLLMLLTTRRSFIAPVLHGASARSATGTKWSKTSSCLKHDSMSYGASKIPILSSIDSLAQCENNKSLIMSVQKYCEPQEAQVAGTLPGDLCDRKRVDPTIC